MKFKRVFIELIAALYICLFLYTATTKLIHFDTTILELNRQPIDDSYSVYLAVLIPAIELICVGLLLFDKTKLLGFIFSGALMLLFTVYIVLIKVNYYGEIPCSCGGMISRLSWDQHLYMNLFFVISSTIALLMSRFTLSSLRNYQQVNSK